MSRYHENQAFPQLVVVVVPYARLVPYEKHPKPWEKKPEND
jgi:hypothetical protein